MADVDADALFEAIYKKDREKVRSLLQDKKYTTVKKSDSRAKYDAEVEVDGYKFLGAYIGKMTGLQFAIMLGNDDVAKDIIDATLKDDLDLTFGGGNTALHLATLLGERDVVKLLLERGADKSIKNNKGFSPIDVVDDKEMSELLA
ncbi:ankyrin [Anaeromyces robustus]|uniref:Ankyrin n=1 Tax=Anaeromyces robustus TaxID=1754192 RepID=A0A1Y1X0B9_9FUNG|nr:ankyrin [Anaeromyces robustus]|eukprot:ORX79269.1 ankyrin [Anaeromyces robustus]